MTLEEYRLDFLDTVDSLSEAASCDKAEVFTQVAAEILMDNNFISDFSPMRFEGVGIRNRRLAVDGYSVDDFDGSITLLIANYDGGNAPETLIRTQARAFFDRLRFFVDEAISHGLDSTLKNGMAVKGLISILREQKADTRKYKLILLTDKVISERIDHISDNTDDSGAIYEYHIWDMGRFFRVSSMSGEYEELEIDLTKYLSEGLPSVATDFECANALKSYLCPIPASVLADLYDKHGSRLLEGNVRSFLSTKRAVNRKIRETIITTPEHFFAFNNGISAIARQVVVQLLPSGPYITHIYGFQIVNGGQTTASLATARFKKESDLAGIHVPMKLTCISTEMAPIMVPKIARSSNSQNKVSDADFFSNHEFHIRIEQISRRILAPSVHGSQFDTHWFYERATGQYQQETAFMTKGEKARFQLQNPKDQVVKKIDIARVRMLWLELPHIVALGIQKNFVRFAESISREWDEDNTRFNEQYYRETIALMIMYKTLEKLVEMQPWYVKGGYRAAYVTYTISLLHYEIRRQFKGHELDLGKIWDRQQLPAVLLPVLAELAHQLSSVLLARDRTIENVTEWAKREACWNRVKELNVSLPADVKSLLVERGAVAAARNEARKDQKLINGIDAQTTVFNLGEQYWTALAQWPGMQKISPIDSSLIANCAANMRLGRIPTEAQCKRMLVIKERMTSEGFKV